MGAFSLIVVINLLNRFLMMAEKSVLMVCHGNICRSTMAHQLLIQLVSQAPQGSPVKKITKVDSCGTSREEIGNSPDPGTQKALQNHGYPKLQHRARQFDILVQKLTASSIIS